MIFTHNHYADISVKTRNHNKERFKVGSYGTGFYLDSLDYGIYITGVHVAGTPERDVSFLSVPGRNGDLLLDNKSWKNIDITYQCAIADGFERKFELFKTDLLTMTGYQRIQDTIYPDVYRLGIVKQGIAPQQLRKNQAGTFEVIFHCKPQRYLIDIFDDFQEILEAPGCIHNSAGFPAKPLITVYGDGPGTLSIDDCTVEILALTDHLSLDCETMTAYRQEGEGVPENRNMDIYAPDFPELLAGHNDVSWTGGITSVKIKPRWWIL